VAPEIIARLPLLVPGHPLPTVAGIVILMAIAVTGTTFWVVGLHYSIPAFAVLLLIMSAFYVRRRADRN
jgi:hypothetical protein